MVTHAQTDADSIAAIEENRDEIESIVGSDLPAAYIAEALLEVADA